jgi:hypothetical protein
LSACRSYPYLQPPSAAAEPRNPKAVPVRPSGWWIATLRLQRLEEALAVRVRRLREQAAEPQPVH